MTNHPDYFVHEVTLPGGKALRAYVGFDKALVTAMRNIGKRTARLSFGKSLDGGRPYWSISESSKEAHAFREAMARAAVRAADQAALSTPM